MLKVVIVTEARTDANSDSPSTLGMVSALKLAITTSATPVLTEVVTADVLVDSTQWLSHGESSPVIFCPLTLNVPDDLPSPLQQVIPVCRDVPSLRQQVLQKFDTPIGDGNLWLPVVLTAKGPLYGEVISHTIVDASSLPDSYYQPFHISDALRQPLYHLARQLLTLISAPPATYLVQFGLHNSQICFDRVLPFPSAPALASLKVQQPDLFTCHWYCLQSLPIIDIAIAPLVSTNSTHKSYQPEL